MMLVFHVERAFVMSSYCVYLKKLNQTNEYFVNIMCILKQYVCKLGMRGDI